MSQVDKEDLRELHTTMREGFDGVHRRLDVLNGRVGRGEVTVGAHNVRITNVEREVFRRGPGGGVTQRDVRMLVAGVTGTIAVATFLWKLLPLVLKAIAP